MRLLSHEASAEAEPPVPIVLLYLGTILLMTAILTGSLLVKAHAERGAGWILALVGILSLVCASQLAVALVNWLATLLATPHVLPRMDLSEGIPPEARDAGRDSDDAHERAEHRGVWSRRLKCGSWRIGTRTCTSAC